MTTKRLGATAVVNENQGLLGIITDGDLRRMLQKNGDFNALTAKNIMSSNPITLEFDQLAVEALRIMRERNITQLVILKHGKYVGMVHLHDLLREGLV